MSTQQFELAIYADAEVVRGEPVQDQHEQKEG